jgi:hypothetical protein
MCLGWTKAKANLALPLGPPSEWPAIGYTTSLPLFRGHIQDYTMVLKRIVHYQMELIQKYSICITNHTLCWCDFGPIRHHKERNERRHNTEISELAKARIVFFVDTVMEFIRDAHVFRCIIWLVLIFLAPTQQLKREALELGELEVGLRVSRRIVTVSWYYEVQTHCFLRKK